MANILYTSKSYPPVTSRAPAGSNVMPDTYTPTQDNTCPVISHIEPNSLVYCHVVKLLRGLWEAEMLDPN